MVFVRGIIGYKVIQESQMDEALEKRVKFLLKCILGRLNYFRRFNVHMAELLEIDSNYLELKKITNGVTLKDKIMIKSIIRGIWS